MEGTTLNFNSWREAFEFGRELKFKTHAANILTTGLKVRFPPEVSETAKELYLRQIHKLAEHSVPIGAFAGTVLTLLGGDSSSIPEDHPVLDAFRRSDSSLSDASAADISTYLEQFKEPEQLAGVVNNVKGIYHEQGFAALENADGDAWQASIMPDTNHPGADVVLTNADTGEVVELQLKATDSVAYVKEHFEAYPDIPVAATSEVASKIEGVQDSGFANEQLKADVSEAVDILDGETVVEATTDLAGDMFQASIIGALFSEGVNALSAIHEGRPVEIDTDRLIAVGKRAAALTVLTGIIW